MPHTNTEAPPRIAIAIMAKAPIPGLAKTRLIPYLGAVGAAALQGWLLQRTVTTALAANLGPVTLWCTPDTNHPAFAACTKANKIALREQNTGNLGDRMHQAITESPCPAGTLIIGTDCPLLSPDHLQSAAAALTDHDAAVTPAEDGGYVLIGLRQPSHRVFEDIEWSSEHVMAQTRQRLSEINWRWTEFCPFWDVDRSIDFERLTKHFPETRRFANMKVDA